MLLAAVIYAFKNNQVNGQVIGELQIQINILKAANEALQNKLNEFEQEGSKFQIYKQNLSQSREERQSLVNTMRNNLQVVKESMNGLKDVILELDNYLLQLEDKDK
ncbi:unnamed protein product (macronuclear) [Paramecium tetraurelia]|uniref:Uncharacterized protein n=1 Tax=Paramecium tetraurelia TaxID=5888 RepID=A0CE93_PARTE|nr:uncharacterized protein GSPATT00037546001 [Paramecium tetraurelia]CAK69110.1 unnamed protein product [Paramecium tetraurelia]|eukprot:XP_001436507.1 hypothetical protein (macronuclear) [Paramecium tetraurelia strain d4-2]